MSSGRQIQRLLPTFLRPLFDPLLGLIFDSKFINLDTEHFKKAVMENVGEYTFQEGELRSHSCLSSLLSSFLFLPLLRSSLPSLPVTLLLSHLISPLPSFPPSLPPICTSTVPLTLHISTPSFYFLIPFTPPNLTFPPLPHSHSHSYFHSRSHLAFDQTGRIINITVAPINNYDPPRLLNYLTAPHVCVWSAACASCAVPGLFDSITLMIKGKNSSFLWLQISIYMLLSYYLGVLFNCFIKLCSMIILHSFSTFFIDVLEQYVLF